MQNYNYWIQKIKISTIITQQILVIIQQTSLLKFSFLQKEISYAKDSLYINPSYPFQFV